MTDEIGLDNFRDHDFDDFDEPTDETPLLPMVVPHTYQLDSVTQETSLGGGSPLHVRVLRDQVEALYNSLSRSTGQNPDVVHTDLFKIEDKELYYKDNRKPLTNHGILRTIGTIADILGKRGLREIGFDIPTGRITPRQATMLNKTLDELPSTSKVTQASDIELESITESVSNSTEDLISSIRLELTPHHENETDDIFDYPVRELLGLDKELRNIRGSLKVETAKKVKLEQHIAREKNKLQEMEKEAPTYTDEQRKEVGERMKTLNEDLKTRKESINILKGKLNNQITSIKETIAKVMDSDTTLGEKIRILFREQGITIVSVLTAFGMIIGFLVETLVPGGGGGVPATGGDPHKNNNSAKEWIKNKLKALASLLGRLAGRLLMHYLE